MNDKLVIETPDAIEEIAVREFMKHAVVDLRRKDNRKRAYEVKYEVMVEGEQNIDKKDAI